MVDVSAEQAVRDHERRKHDLYFALRTRVLTDEEWEEVVRYGDQLNIKNMVSYYPSEKTIELNDAYLQQFKLRRAARGSLMGLVYDPHLYRDYITHRCPSMKVTYDGGPECIDLGFTEDGEWLLSEYEDFGSYYVIQFCPWCGGRLPDAQDSEMARLIDEMKSKKAMAKNRNK